MHALQRLKDLIARQADMQKAVPGTKARLVIPEGAAEPGRGAGRGLARQPPPCMGAGRTPAASGQSPTHGTGASLPRHAQAWALKQKNDAIALKQEGGASATSTKETTPHSKAPYKIEPAQH